MSWSRLGPEAHKEKGKQLVERACGTSSGLSNALQLLTSIKRRRPAPKSGAPSFKYPASGGAFQVYSIRGGMLVWTFYSKFSIHFQLSEHWQQSTELCLRLKRKRCSSLNRFFSSSSDKTISIATHSWPPPFYFPFGRGIQEAWGQTDLQRESNAHCVLSYKTSLAQCVCVWGVMVTESRVIYTVYGVLLCGRSYAQGPFRWEIGSLTQLWPPFRFFIYSVV